MRCLIVTMDASVIIGKGGRHIAEIRVSDVFVVLLFEPSSLLGLNSFSKDGWGICKYGEGADHACPLCVPAI